MRCKNCKQIFEPKHFNQKYCFDPECVKVWVEKAKEKNWKKLKKNESGIGNNTIVDEKMSNVLQSICSIKGQKQTMYFVRW